MYLIFSKESTKKRTFLVVSLILFCLCFCFLSFVENGPIVDITQMLDDPLGLEKSEALMLMPPQTWRCCVLSRPLNLGVKNLCTLLMPVKMWFAIVCTFVPHWQKHCHLLYIMYILKSGLLKSNLPPMSWFVRFWAAIPAGLDMILCQNCSVGFICLSQTAQGLLYALAALAFCHCYDNATILICRQFQYVCFNDWNPSEVDASPIVKSQPATTW